MNSDSIAKALACALAVLASLLSTACGSGSSNDGSLPRTTYAIGGTVTGLVAGTSVVLQDNGSSITSVSINSSFSFNTELGSGISYAVTVIAQPTGEMCTVTNGSGVVGNSNVSVAVTCTPTSYTISGNASGLLPGNSVVLTNNGTNSTTVSANSSFTFSTALPSGSLYSVLVSTQPLGQTCAISNANGTLAGMNISNVNVECTALSYTVSARVFGLLPNTYITLQDNSPGSFLTAMASGTYTFQTTVASGSNYAVMVSTQPSGQTCFVEGAASGTVRSSNISVNVICPWHVVYVSDLRNIVGNYVDPVTGNLLPDQYLTSSQIDGPKDLVVSSDNRFIYALDSTGEIDAFVINQSTGVLTLVPGSPFGVGSLSAPQTITIDSSGKYLYVGNVGTGCGSGSCPPPTSIAAFTVDTTTGALTSITGSPYATSSSPSALVADTTAEFLFTALATYSINPSTGALSVSVPSGTGCANTYADAGLQECSATVSPTGTVLLTSGGSYAIDPTTGALSLATAVSPTGGAGTASFVAVSPDGQYLFISVGNNISGYSVESTTGTLTALPGSSLSMPNTSPVAQTLSLAVDPSGQFLYVASNVNSDVSVYTIDPTTGAVAPASQSPFASTSQGGAAVTVATIN